ncbi:MAG TPA: stage V sporulation protein AE [Syntrophaceticus sp.]|jgi:stage V sporulation protein AE|uniref:Stage V sporulation protein AEB (Modular protein) n=1 Tax=Syntrophaceticus schinkii TaxID=499207 RepID=A0A0B7MFT2_9FIRM|nr:Stage V sporulation protein AEB (modular protein) [Syntrophaceticus schinkii]HHY30267.1 stage V sporulation protein AE [Syntrophaceticus sp.]
MKLRLPCFSCNFRRLRGWGCAVCILFYRVSERGVDSLSFLIAFIVGGLICVIGQLWMDLTRSSITPAHILVGFVTAGAILSAFGLYQPLVDFAGAGATIPLSGFGHTLAQGAIRAVQQKGLLGAFTGGVEATAVGIATAVIFGYVTAVLFNPRS